MVRANSHNDEKKNWEFHFDKSEKMSKGITSVGNGFERSKQNVCNLFS